MAYKVEDDTDFKLICNEERADYVKAMIAIANISTFPFSKFFNILFSCIHYYEQSLIRKMVSKETLLL